MKISVTWIVLILIYMGVVGYSGYKLGFAQGNEEAVDWCLAYVANMTPDEPEEDLFGE